MSFASLLQEAEMVPPFLLMYAAAVVLSSFNNTCSLVRSKIESLVGAKASKHFLIYHFNSFAAFSEI